VKYGRVYELPSPCSFSLDDCGQQADQPQEATACQIRDLDSRHRELSLFRSCHTDDASESEVVYIVAGTQGVRSALSIAADRAIDKARVFLPQYRVIDTEALHHPEDLWTATFSHVVVAMVNTDQLGDIPAPTKWEDFLDPAWKGKLAIADPNNSSTAYTILWGIDQLMGQLTQSQ